MTEGPLIAAWLIMCVGLWASIARDPITIAFCAIATVPYTVLLIRDARERHARHFRSEWKAEVAAGKTTASFETWVAHGGHWRNRSEAA